MRKITTYRKSGRLFILREIAISTAQNLVAQCEKVRLSALLEPFYESLTESAGICLLHRPYQGEADRSVQHDVIGRGEWHAEPLYQPGRHERRCPSCQRQRDAVGETHRCDPSAEGEDFDDHRALESERHPEWHSQKNLAEHEQQRLPI